jgi:hypothetical protein
LNFEQKPAAKVDGRRGWRRRRRRRRRRKSQ